MVYQFDHQWELDHLPERDTVRSRLVEALRPGGWLVVLGNSVFAARGRKVAA